MSAKEKAIKVYNNITCYLYPLALLLLPFYGVNRGVDVSDTTYSLARSLFMEDIAGSPWSVAYELSDLLTRLLMKLPGKGSLLMMNCYTALFISAMAWIAYFVLSREMSRHLVFFGEILAISLCWCPSVILYNYLSYFMLLIAILLLYRASVCSYERSAWRLFLAGAILGLSIFARLPNVVFAGFILLVFYTYFVDKINRGLFKTVLTCVGGYIAGFLLAAVPLSVKYGMDCIPNMLSTVLGSSESATDYTAGYALLRTVKAYTIEWPWILTALLVILGGIVLFRIFRGRFKALKGIVYIAVLLLWLRFAYGRGMFGFTYEEVFSMMAFVTIFLILGIVGSIFTMLQKAAPREEKLRACLVLLWILLLPIGSNNNIYPILNSMFLIAPLLLHMLQGVILPSHERFMKAHGLSAFPLKAMLALFLFCMMYQTFLFGLTYVFRDGTEGAMDTRITADCPLRGMYTTKERAESLTDLADYVASQDYEGRRFLFYGNVPGLSYVLNKPCALSHTWPDLDTYEYEVLLTDLSLLTKRPVFITSLEAGKRLLTAPQGVKEEKLHEMLVEGDFKVRFISENDAYLVIE